MSRRFYLKYLLLGLAFGIADWHYLDLLASAHWQSFLGNGPLAPLVGVPLILALNWGIWLVPVVPAAIYEARRTGSARVAATAAVVIWCATIVGYYLYYAVLLTFVGLPGMDFLLFSHRGASAVYWRVWLNYFNSLIVAQFLEWIVVAVAGGALVGVGCAWMRNRWVRRHAPSHFET